MKNNLEVFVKLYINILNSILNQNINSEEFFLYQSVKETSKMNNDFIQNVCDEFGLEK